MPNFGLLVRIHTANEALVRYYSGERRLVLLRVSGLTLFIGLPEQSLQTLKTSLQNLTAAGLQHLSVYGLTIEKNTPLAGMLDKGKVELPDEDCQLAMYELVQEYLEALGTASDMCFQIMQCQVRSQGITLFTGIICRICLLAVPPAALMAVNVLQQQIL